MSKHQSVADHDAITARRLEEAEKQEEKLKF